MNVSACFKILVKKTHRQSSASSMTSDEHIVKVGNGEKLSPWLNIITVYGKRFT